jgi:hypothetical protein
MEMLTAKDIFCIHGIKYIYIPWKDLNIPDEGYSRNVPDEM